MLKSVLVGYLYFIAFLCLIAAAELAWARGRRATLSSVANAVLFGAIFIPVATLCGALSHRSGPLLSLGVVGGVIGAFVGDFFYYWYHRAQHSFAWLWRFHSVHHSVEEMGPGKGYHHLTEAPLRAFLVAAPVGFLVNDSSLIGLVFGLHGMYLHSTTRLNFGPLAWLIADNRTHRIHHSLEPGHFNRNFGAVTMLWDKLFGTAYFPSPGEWPKIGLPDRREPETIYEYVAVQLEGTRGGVGTV